MRYIYNRINLEQAKVRAAAVSALASFAYKIPSLRQNILYLLNKCLPDNDDEVRERAFFYINLLEDKKNQSFIDGDILKSLSDEDQSTISMEDIETEKKDMMDFVFDADQFIDVDALESYVL